jgi:toxin ParE1/3/4
VGQARSVKLRYTLPALADLSAILDYIGSRTNDPVIRRMTTTPYPYLIFYEATDTQIIIHAVRHAARQPSGMPGSA